VLPARESSGQQTIESDVKHGKEDITDFQLEGIKVSGTIIFRDFTIVPFSH
jgi:hypothetical protein